MTTPTFDLMSGTWSDGRREPILEYFDARRGYKAQRPKPRKDRPPEAVFPFGVGSGVNTHWLQTDLSRWVGRDAFGEE